MFGSQILEVVIGLVVVYLVLSIGCSGIKEVFASLFALRAKTLEMAIRNMLKGSATDYTSKIYGHSLIASTAPEGQKPSYISARSFALALFDIVAPAIPGQPQTITSLRTAVSQIPEEKLRSTLLNFIDSSNGTVEDARSKVEHWFDDTMERISGWYKRMAQKIIFVSGLALCFALNADSLMVVKELWSDQALAHAIVAQANKKVETGFPADPEKQNAFLQAVATDIRNTNAPPIGWARDSADIRSWHTDPWSIAFKLFGIFLTAFAITLGAPFWFDLLNTIINLRLSGEPPAASK
jgi:hypothetical protein